MIPNLTLNFKNEPALTVVINNTPSAVKQERIHAIDWLRVLAFGILVIYHTAEVFTTWNWYVKNDETSLVLSLVMKFFHEWRMILLFVISGAATQLALGKRTMVKLLQDRTIRILIPLLAGMMLVIPPQIYFIRLNQGEVISFWDFYLQLFNFRWYPTGNFHWLHLWYMAFLFVFTLMLLPLLTILKTEKGKKAMGTLSHLISSPFLLFSMALVMEIPFYLAKYIRLGENLESLILYFPYYAFGALFLTSNEIRSSITRFRRTGLCLALITVICLYAGFWIKDINGHALFTFGLSESNLAIFKSILKSLNCWFWVLTIIGYGLRYLTKGSASLDYANKAIAPFYILHQTVIIILAYFMVTLSYDITTKFYLIFSTTFIGIMLLYHFLLSRTKITRLLFGIRQ